jgi:hypothetical protein
MGHQTAGEKLRRSKPTLLWLLLPSFMRCMVTCHFYQGNEIHKQVVSNPSKKLNKIVCINMRKLHGTGLAFFLIITDASKLEFIVSKSTNIQQTENYMKQKTLKFPFHLISIVEYLNRIDSMVLRCVWHLVTKQCTRVEYFHVFSKDYLVSSYSTCLILL